jgi:hypothetical protein
MDDEEDYEKPDEGSGRHRDKDTEEISRDGQQEGRPLPPPDDGSEKH